jgi:FAD/FMN-containing dehydrogenase
MGEDPQSARAWTFAWAKQHQTPVALLKAAAPLRNGSNGAGGDDDEDTLWWPRPPALALMRNLKQTLDPNGTLNPGRFVGRI